jgi:hypothetical protein
MSTDVEEVVPSRQTHALEVVIPGLQSYYDQLRLVEEMLAEPLSDRERILLSESVYLIRSRMAFLIAGLSDPDRS